MVRYHRCKALVVADRANAEAVGVSRQEQQLSVRTRSHPYRGLLGPVCPESRMVPGHPDAHRLLDRTI